MKKGGKVKKSRASVGRGKSCKKEGHDGKKVTYNLTKEKTLTGKA